MSSSLALTHRPRTPPRLQRAGVRNGPAVPFPKVPIWGKSVVIAKNSCTRRDGR